MIECRWCGETHAKGICRRVKAIEFFENGEVRRVEFLTPADTAIATMTPAVTPPATTTTTTP